MKIKFIIFITFFLNAGLFAQSKKIVDLVVVGTGETADFALQNAFKKAIEQSFGTFITAKTEILNDEITKNELISVSNGNIQSYEVLSTAKLNTKEISITVKVSVSISNLVSFVKSKGISAELKGSLLSANILQQEFNEANELKATKELTNTLTEILKKSFDYEVKIDEPTKGEDDYWNIPLTTSVISNNNINIFKQFLLKSLAGLSMNPEEVANYVKLKKPVYKIAIGEEQYFNENGVSRDLFLVTNKSTLTKNNVPKIEINKSELKKISELKDKIFYICYSVRGIHKEESLDTIIATSNNLEAEINKIRDQLNAEAETKLIGGTYWYYTPDQKTFNPIVYWTKLDFTPPVYFFRNVESASLIYRLFQYDLKNILFNISINNEIKSISGKELLINHQDNRGRNQIQFVDNDFKLCFDKNYHETNSIVLPTRSKYFDNRNNRSSEYIDNVSFDVNQYWEYLNTYIKLVKANSNFGNSNNAILREKFEQIPYPFIDFLKFISFKYPNTIPLISSYRNAPVKNETYNLVLTLDSFKEKQKLYSFRFIDKLTKDELSKISNYKINIFN